MKTFVPSARRCGRPSMLLMVILGVVLAACDSMQGVRQPSEYETQIELARDGSGY